MDRFDISKHEDNLPGDFKDYDDIIKNISTDDIDTYRERVNNLEEQHLLKGYSTVYYDELFNKQYHQTKKHIYCVFTFINYKYIFGGGKERRTHNIPLCIGYIWHLSALYRDLPTVVTHDAINLNNWEVIDETKEFSLENLHVKYSITGNESEKWFYLIHIAIEGYGSMIVKKLSELETHIDTEDKLFEFMNECSDLIRKYTDTLGRLKERCNPMYFFTQIRIFLTGFADPNIFPDGMTIDNTNIVLRFKGGSAAQSPLLQSIDAAFGIKLVTDKDYLIESRQYMSSFHRELILHLENNIKNVYVRVLENYAKNNNKNILIKYNDIVQKIFSFRNSHRTIARTYIESVVAEAMQAKKRGDMDTFISIMGNDVTRGRGAATSTTVERDTFKMLEHFRDETKLLNLISLDNTQKNNTQKDNMQYKVSLTTCILLCAGGILFGYGLSYIVSKYNR